MRKWKALNNQELSSGKKLSIDFHKPTINSYVYEM